ncbi:MAG: hypothetical protein ABRQ26_07745 [Syntrophomonadaceae bacterium]
MRQWRVGTISMGLLLVGGGLGLMAAQYNTQAITAAMRWWPLLLVVLGIEVLVYTYLKKSEDGRVRYDIFSIIIILFLVVSGVSLKTAQDVGIAEWVQEQLRLSNYTIALPETQVQIPSQVQKIVLSSEQNSQLEIRSTSIETMLAGGNIMVRAKSKEEAQQMAEQALKVSTREAGNTLFITLSGGHNLKISLPARVELEVNAPSQKVALTADKVLASYVIIGGSDSEVLLPAGADLSITAVNDAPARISGNLAWTTSAGVSGQTYSTSAAANGNNGQVQVKSDGSNLERDAVQYHQKNDYVSRVQLGNGTNKMTIICEGNCTIRQLP